LRPGPAITLLLTAAPSGRYQARQTQTYPATDNPRKHWKSPKSLALRFLVMQFGPVALVVKTPVF